MKPSKVPQLAAKSVRKILDAKGITDHQRAGKLTLLLIRGYYEDSMGKKGVNDRGIYDDALFVVTDSNVTAYNANTDPSTYRRGIATLVPGIWTYTVGRHKNQYTALRQAEPVAVHRDGKGIDKGMFGINVHKGGLLTTSSLGCQTIPPDQWGHFIGLIKNYLKVTDADARKHPYGIPGIRFNLVLITEDEMSQILG